MNDEKERIVALEVQTEQNANDIRGLRDEIKVIHKFATSIEVLATEMKGLALQIVGVKEDVNEVKNQVKDVKSQISEVKDEVKDVENLDSSRKAKIIESIKEKVIWVFVGGLVGYIFYLLFPFVK